MQERFDTHGAEDGSPALFAPFIRTVTATWARVVKHADVEVDH